MGSFIRFTGLVDSNGQFQRRVGWETDTPTRWPEPDASLRLRAVDETGKVMLEVHPGRRLDACRAVGDRAYEVIGYLPFAIGLSSIELWIDDRLLHRATVAANPPRIFVRKPRIRGGRLAVSWSGAHDLPLRYVVSLETGTEAVPLAYKTDLEQVLVAIDDLPGGDACRVAVLATDGTRSTYALSAPFPLTRSRPHPVIVEPADLSTAEPDQPLSLMGWAVQGGGTRREVDLRWTVDGRALEVSGNVAATEPLVPGKHVVELVAGDSPIVARARVTVRARTASQSAWHRLVAAIDQVSEVKERDPDTL